MQKAAKEKSSLLWFIALAVLTCAPSYASSVHDLSAENRVEIFLLGGQNRTGQQAFDTANRVEKYDSLWGVASESIVAPKGTTSAITSAADDLLMPIRSGDGLRRTIDIRRASQAAGDTISARKNIAFADVNVTAFQGELRAVSGQAARNGFVQPTDIRLFNTREAGGFFRGFEAETHLLENLGQRLSPDSFGTVRLFSERPVCSSCQNVIQQFQTKFPKVKIVVSGGP